MNEPSLILSADAVNKDFRTENRPLQAAKFSKLISLAFDLIPSVNNTYEEFNEKIRKATIVLNEIHERAVEQKDVGMLQTMQTLEKEIESRARFCIAMTQKPLQDEAKQREKIRRTLLT